MGNSCPTRSVPSVNAPTHHEGKKPHEGKQSASRNVSNMQRHQSKITPATPGCWGECGYTKLEANDGRRSSDMAAKLEKLKKLNRNAFENVQTTMGVFGLVDTYLALVGYYEAYTIKNGTNTVETLDPTIDYLAWNMIGSMFLVDGACQFRVFWLTKEYNVTSSAEMAYMAWWTFWLHVFSICVCFIYQAIVAVATKGFGSTLMVAVGVTALRMSKLRPIHKFKKSMEAAEEAAEESEGCGDENKDEYEELRRHYYHEKPSEDSACACAWKLFWGLLLLACIVKIAILMGRHHHKQPGYGASSVHAPLMLSSCLEHVGIVGGTGCGIGTALGAFPFGPVGCVIGSVGGFLSC